MLTQERDFERRNRMNSGSCLLKNRQHFQNTSFILPWFLLLILLASCSRKNADLIVYNGKIYTVDGAFTVAEAMAIGKGTILATGSDEEILAAYSSDSLKDLQGKAVYPGFIDAHCHFFGYASDLLKCDLTGTLSFKALVDTLKKFSAQNRFEWLLGRGWDQNDWPEHDFPDRYLLDSLFPNQPVFLMRIDGHAALCNGAALRKAGITCGVKTEGGEILCKNGIPTGILIDNAVELVKAVIPPTPENLNEEAILRAQRNCFEVGLTTVDDAGLGRDSIELLRRMQKEGRLKLKVYAMISQTPSTMAHYFRTGPIIEDRLTVRAVKVYADGALGSRGALMKSSYSDQPGHYGFLLNSVDVMNEIADEALEHGFQVCTHAIGDSANAIVLDIYASHLNGKNDRRWRIEHCQVVSNKEMKRYGQYSVIPSVQPTHATSDMYWASERLGNQRIQDAYSYASLLKSSDHIALGTDFPVEGIDPILTFHAAVSRKDIHGRPDTAFRADQALKRKDALRGMTIDAAFSNFEEHTKGSLEPGKSADFIVLDTDILEAEEMVLPKTKTLATYVNGECVYSR
jgi:predicted amidohydrolase YtcJ